ncbi:MAG: DNA translocase FtsK 4TM domain-containing protein, partial [Deltaproteobacteria bacterium]|nr:DNA translocase FtsK 4TM domain-containing protein [Deltaproteobacteria bacterium]
LVGLFGLGAFWIPVICLVTSIQILGSQSGKTIALTVGGGALLSITTGALLALQQNHYEIFSAKFSSGGLIGIPLKRFLVSFANPTGASTILILLWVIGFILATGFSFQAFFKRFWLACIFAADRFQTLHIKWKERRKKAKKRLKTQQVKHTQSPKKIKIKAPEMPRVPKTPIAKQKVFDFMRPENGFQLPSVNFLDDADETLVKPDDENLRMQSKMLEKKLADFGIEGKVVAVTPGPVITTFEYEPAPGVKINRIVSLTDDLALTLRAMSIRIVAPIPGKAVIGIEIPNDNRLMVRFKDIVISGAFQKSNSLLTLCLGKDIVGNPVVAQLNKMPHLLIAGATGSGKSVALNTMICSFLYKASPETVKLMMVDPKRIELSVYDGIPHLITPVVTDVKKATNALYWAVREMERRYELLSEKKVRNIDQYNKKIEKALKSENPEAEPPPEKLPYIVIIIDELADLMIVASRDVEVALTRLAQMARAAGIHLILATQRPSVDVLTGIIKANFPTRLSFQVSSKTDSRTIIDMNGAESLLGHGDMLFLPPGTAKLQRIHGAYISEAEIARIIEFLKTQKKPEYNIDVTEDQKQEAGQDQETEYDEKYDEAVALVTKTRQASISMVQRHLRIGYNRAARIIEVMEKEGVVGPSDGAKPREVLIANYDDIN